MKLKFKTHKLVEFNADAVYDKTIRYLKEKNYNVVKQTATTISFNDQIVSWKLVPNYTYYSKINEGQFDLTRQNGQTNICLTYHLSITFELIQLLIIIFASTYMGYKVLLLAIFFTLNFIFKVLNIHNNIIENLLKI